MGGENWRKKRRKVLKEGKNLFVEEKNIWRRKKIVDEKNNEGGLKENIWRRRNVFLAEKIKELVANDHHERPAPCK